MRGILCPNLNSMTFIIHMCNDTSRYLDDIFTIDKTITLNLNIPDIHPTEVQFNNANTSDEETSFLDLNIKVIDSDVQTSVDDFGFPIVNFPWMSADVPRLPSYGVTFISLLDLLDAVIAFLISVLKVFTSLTHGYRYHKLRKTVLQVIFWAFIQIWWNIVSIIYFWRDPSPGLIRWSSL